MTVGEKIQFYRKKNGLSQEELGQEMLVSRQTISLWEMDKTLPTVDNLLRLKEIFSISIDDILSESDPTAPREQEETDLKESLVFQYTKSDIRQIVRYAVRPIIKKAVIFAVTCILLFIFLAAASAPDGLLGILFGVFLLGTIGHVKSFFIYKASWTAAEKTILAGTYHYEVFDQYFILNISRDGEIRRTWKCGFDEIEKVHSFGHYLILQISGQTYIIKKDALRKDSPFHTVGHKNPKRVETKKTNELLKILSILLVIFSIMTIWGAMMGVAIASAINRALTENMWIFFLFTPIPVASILFGFYLKKKGYKYLKNVVVGIIMTAFLCIYGSFSFMLADAYSHSEEPILRIEEMLSIEIPRHSQITSMDWTKGTQSMPRGYIFYTSDIYFHQGDVAEFEKDLPFDSKWISTVPNDMIGITSYFCDLENYDYLIIYNTQTNEFNQLPSESGKYRFINVRYNSKSNSMKLVEYEIEYMK